MIQNFLTKAIDLFVAIYVLTMLYYFIFTGDIDWSTDSDSALTGYIFAFLIAFGIAGIAHKILTWMATLIGRVLDGIFETNQPTQQATPTAETPPTDTPHPDTLKAESLERELQQLKERQRKDNKELWENSGN
jgi:type IV secretory pathway VirB10-like protein